MVACSNLTALGTQNATSIVTPSISPTSNRLLLATVESRTNLTTDPNEPTLSGNGLTWVKVNTVVWDTTGPTRKRTTTFRALGASPSAGAVTADFGGQTQTDMDIIIDEFSGVDTTGTNGSGAVVQSVTGADGSNTVNTMTITLAAFGSVNNATYGVFAIGQISADTSGTGFTAIAEVSTTSINQMNSEFRNDNDTTVNMSWAAPNTEIGGIAIEIKAAGNSAPTVALNTPADAATGQSTTPTLNFTGTDADGDTVEYNVQVHDDVGLQFDGSQNYVNLGAIGSLGSNLASGVYMRIELTTTQTTSFSLGYYQTFPATHTGISMSFNRNGANVDVLGSVSIGINDTSNRYLITTSTGINFYDGAKHTFDVTINVATQTVTLLFDGVSQTISYNNRDAVSGWDNLFGNFLLGVMNDSGSNQRYFAGTIHSFKIGTSSGALYGNYTIQENTGTTLTDSSGNGNNGTLTGTPVPSWVYGTAVIDKVSSADAGFTAGHPFASGAAKDYTVQSALTPLTTYFWRVRAIDPLGSNGYGAWSTARSFTVAAASAVKIGSFLRMFQ